MHRFGYDLHDTWMRGGVIKLSFAQVFNTFYSFSRNQNMHVDLHEHGCKDKEETEQAVTNGM